MTEDEQTRERRERAEQDARRKAVAAEYDADQARARVRLHGADCSPGVCAIDCAALAGKAQKITEERPTNALSENQASPAGPCVTGLAGQSTRPDVGSVHPWATARADMEAHTRARWDNADNPGCRARICHDAMEREFGSGWIRQNYDIKGDSPCNWKRLPDEPVTPAQAMEAATTVFDETPLDAARRELEELVHGPVHPSHMVTLVDCAIDKLVAASRSETFNANESGWRHAAETQNRLWSKKCTDLSEERFAHQETRADRDRLRREASLALDAVTQLRRVHADLGRLIETTDALLKEGA